MVSEILSILSISMHLSIGMNKINILVHIIGLWKKKLKESSNTHSKWFSTLKWKWSISL